VLFEVCIDNRQNPLTESTGSSGPCLGSRPSGNRSVIRRFCQLLEMVRFSHTVFALPFALLAAVMAWVENLSSTPPVGFRWQELLGILLAMVTARSAAMSFNRLVDRNIDALNPRTEKRHLPSGELSFFNVVLFTVLCSAGFVASTLLFLPQNPLPLYASVPVLLFLFGYSHSKKFTWLSHFWLGVALMLAPVAAWIAIRAELEWPPVILGLAVMFWVAGFDIIYSCQDFDFDLKMRLWSVPARFGVKSALRVAAFCHFVMILMLVVLPLVYPEFGLVYIAAVSLIGLLLLYEHWLVRPDDLSRVNLAFFHVNSFVSIGLFIAGMADLLI